MGPGDPITAVSGTCRQDASPGLCRGNCIKLTVCSRPVTKARYTGSHMLSQEHTRPEALPKPTVWTSLEQGESPPQAQIPEKTQLSQGDPS